MQTQTAVSSNGHSMVGELKRVLVCSPRTAGWSVSDSADRWQELGFAHRPDADTAGAQHEDMCRELKAAGAEIYEMHPSPDLSLDAVYAHDACFPTDFGWIILHPGKKNRMIEAKRQQQFVEQSGIQVLGEVQAPGTAEAGDMVWLDVKTVLIGQGYRTNAPGIAQIREMLSDKGIKVVSAPLPYGQGPSACLHLMSLISLLDEKTALVDLPWLAVETVELLCSRNFQFIEIEPAERETLACNVLALGNRTLLALEENRKTKVRLQHAGFDVRTFGGSELCINGSGGPTCLTRPFFRR